MFGKRCVHGLALLAGLALLVPATPVSSQSAADFLFRNPSVTLGMRFGYAAASASSEIFDFTRETLTVDKGDFSGSYFGGELGIRATDRVDIAIGFGVAGSEILSEMRDWVDLNDLPIEQTTDFRRIPLTVGVEAYLKDRGRSVGRFAWIPTDWAPFVGAGAGFVWYRFDQSGNFVDFETLDIFADHFVSDGKAPTVHAFAGADYSLSPQFFLTAEGRYTWARAEMSQDFVDFDRMDLSGFQASAGISVRF